MQHEQKLLLFFFFFLFLFLFLLYSIIYNVAPNEFLFVILVIRHTISAMDETCIPRIPWAADSSNLPTKGRFVGKLKITSSTTKANDGATSSSFILESAYGKVVTIVPDSDESKADDITKRSSDAQSMLPKLVGRVVEITGERTDDASTVSCFRVIALDGGNMPQFDLDCYERMLSIANGC